MWNASKRKSLRYIDITKICSELYKFFGLTGNFSEIYVYWTCSFTCQH